MSFHAPNNSDLFATVAACGATADTEPGGILRLHQPGVEVTCSACRIALLSEVRRDR